MYYGFIQTVTFLQVKWRVSGADGCPGPAVLRAVMEDLSLAPDSATLLPQLEVEIIARAKPGSRGPATPSNVKSSQGPATPSNVVSVLPMCHYDKVSMHRKNPLSIIL